MINESNIYVTQDEDTLSIVVFGSQLVPPNVMHKKKDI